MAHRSIIGPMIGGALSRPCISYPELFHRGTLWDRYPYLLPNLFSAATVIVGVVVGFLFLDETHAAQKLQRDRRRELDSRIAALVRRATVCKCRGPSVEKRGLLPADTPKGDYGALDAPPRRGPAMHDEDEPLPAYQSRQNSPKLAPQADAGSAEPVVPRSLASRADGKSCSFTKPVILNIMSYGILALCVCSSPRRRQAAADT